MNLAQSCQSDPCLSLPLQERLHSCVRLPESCPGDLLPAAGSSTPQLRRPQPARQRLQPAQQGQAEAAEARGEPAVSCCARTTAQPCGMFISSMENLSRSSRWRQEALPCLCGVSSLPGPEEGTLLALSHSTFWASAGVTDSIYQRLRTMQRLGALGLHGLYRDSPGALQTPHVP